MQTGWGTQTLPIIQLEVIAEDPELSEEPGDSITIEAHNLPVDPETLLTLVQNMHSHPEHRRQLAAPQARLLLKPPSRRWRWSEARRIRRAAGAQRKA